MAYALLRGHAGDQSGSRRDGSRSRPAGGQRRRWRAGERVPVRARHLDLDDLAYPAARSGRRDVDDLVALGAALHAVTRQVPLLALARALDEHPLARPDERREVRGAERLDHLEEAREPLALHVLGHVVRQAQRRGVRPRRVLEAEERHEADLAHERERLREVVLGLAGEADDDVGREREPGRARA